MDCWRPPSVPTLSPLLVLGAPGAFWFQGDRMFVACRDGVLEILELQPEGKRPLKPKEFENGIKGAGIARFDGVTA